jgi:hypothetical protein
MEQAMKMVQAETMAEQRDRNTIAAHSHTLMS